MKDTKEGRLAHAAHGDVLGFWVLASGFWLLPSSFFLLPSSFFLLPFSSSFLVRALVGERLDVLNKKIEELCALPDDLSVLVRNWDTRLSQTPAGQRAHLLSTLGTTAIERVRQTRKSTPRRS